MQTLALQCTGREGASSSITGAISSNFTALQHKITIMDGKRDDGTKSKEMCQQFTWTGDLLTTTTTYL